MKFIFLALLLISILHDYQCAPYDSQEEQIRQELQQQREQILQDELQRGEQIRQEALQEGEQIRQEAQRHKEETLREILQRGEQTRLELQQQREQRRQEAQQRREQRRQEAQQRREQWQQEAQQRREQRQQEAQQRREQRQQALKERAFHQQQHEDPMNSVAGPNIGQITGGGALHINAGSNLKDLIDSHGNPAYDSSIINVINGIETQTLTYLNPDTNKVETTHYIRDWTKPNSKYVQVDNL